MYVIEVPFLDLEQVFNSAQNLRWFKIKGNKFIIQDGSSVVKAEQQRKRLLLSCTEDEFYDKWYHYFDMGTDYADAYHSIARRDKFLKKCAVRSGGVRIIKQDLFECVISSIIFATNNDASICKFIMNSIAHACGVENKQSIRGVGKITWHSFPKPEDIIKNIDKLILSTELRGMILSVCEDMVDGWFDLDVLKYMTKDEAKSYLSDFILDDNAIDYICLYGLHDLECIPQCKFADKVKQLKLSRSAGLVYAYVTHHKLNPPKNMESEMKVGAHRWG